MKITTILLGLSTLALTAMSCTQPSVAEEDALYVTPVADGEDGEIGNDPDTP